MADPTYCAMLERLYSLGRAGVRLGLERMESALRQLGEPHRAFPSVHIAGTNGKGSTAAMLAACLRRAGYRTGLYTSPHLCRFTERVQIDGREISPSELARLVGRVLEVEPGLSFFEAATAAAFCYFAEQRAAMVVVETGLGGRLDATNVITPRVSVLTRIDLDHTELLGTERAAVAREKAGIIKRGVPVVSAPAAPEVERVLRSRCVEVGAPLLLAGERFTLERDGRGLSFRGPTLQLGGLRLALVGDHQLENAALCLAALDLLRQHGMALSADSLVAGLAEVRWPGRMEWVDGNTLLDGAHNASGAEVLARAIRPRAPFRLVMGLLGPKEPLSVIAPLRPLAARAVFTRPRSSRAIAPEVLAGLVPGSEVAPDLATALRVGSRDTIPTLITGSLYLVGEARGLLLGEPCDPVRIADPIAAGATP